jgi:hypothetical protein
LDEADHIAKSLEGDAAALQAELLAIDRRKIEMDAEFEETKLARMRLLDFRPRIGPDF